MVIGLEATGAKEVKAAYMKTSKEVDRCIRQVEFIFR